MKTTKIFILAILVLGIGVFLFTSNTKDEDDRISIGVLVPLSGDLSIFGEGIKRGVDLATAEYPEEEFRVTYEDAGNIGSRETVSAYKKLVEFDNADIIIGPFGPDQTLSVAHLGENDSGPTLFTISLCEDRLLEYSHIFCSFPSIPSQTRAGIELMENLGHEKLYVITQVGELGEIFTNTIESMGESGNFSVVDTELINPESTDFRTVVTKVKSSDADVVYMGMIPTPAHIILRQLSELEFDGTIIVTTDVTEESLSEIPFPHERTYFAGSISLGYEENFTENYTATYNESPNLYPALGNSVAHMILSSLQNNGWSNLETLNDDVLEVTASQTAIKEFRYNDDHTVSIPHATLQLVDNKLIEI